MVNNIKKKLFLFLFSLIASGIVLEITLSIFFDKKEYSVWPPNYKKEFIPNSKVMVGINGKSFVSANKFGVRGSEFSKNSKINILTVGGSTTECLYLDDTETWPYLLESELKEDYSENHVRVGNIGRSGNGSKEHILHLKHITPQFPQINLIVVLMGINDFAAFIAKREFLVTSLEELYDRKSVTYHRAFTLTPNLSGKELFFWKKTATWQYLRNLKSSINDLFKSSDFIQDTTGGWLETLRDRRIECSEFVNCLPDLKLGLQEYAQNIQEMISISKQYGVEILFLTQPTIWKDNLPEEMEKLCWFGWTNRNLSRVNDGKLSENSVVIPPDCKRYYGIEQLAIGMNLYNRLLIRICRQNEIKCYDLASALSKNTKNFYDDCHFNESGARNISKHLSNYIKKTYHSGFSGN